MKSDMSVPFIPFSESRIGKAAEVRAYPKGLEV